MSWWQRILHRPFFIRILHWEFWSFHAVYIWVYPIWLFLCVRSRSFFFFSAANPSMENGGFLMESKMKIYGILPEEYYPKTILVNSLDSVEQITRSVKDAGFRYPLIVKPDVGGRGRGVKKISNEDELLHYLKRFPFDMLVQEFVPYEEEIGVFYFRYPGEGKGAISGIVGKQFLTVKGDGKSTIEELLKRDKRSILQLPVLAELLGEQLQQVLPEGKDRLLVPYGNHARGALFLDYSHWVDDELVETIETICKRIPGFFYGRLDIRYRSIEKLKQCQEFSLIEVNGAGSEPTHMYDPRHSLLNAWKEIVKHWIILWRVSRSNNKRGIKYMSRREGIEMFRQARKYDRLLDKIVSEE